MLKPFPSVLNSFDDTERWSDYKVYRSMCDISLPACSNTVSLILLIVSSRQLSEHVFSGHFTK